MSTTAAPDVAREEAVAQVGAALKGILAATRRLRGRQTHRPGEVSHAQHQLLHGLAGKDELSTGDLACAVDLSPATVTQMLDHLVAIGLVERRRSERDRRIVTCSLTDLGRELVAARRTHMEGLFAAAIEAFTASELESAAAVLDSLRGMFESLDAEGA